MNQQVAQIEKEKTKEVSINDLPQSSGLMNLVERMAISPDIDPDRVERAFEMYKQVRLMDSEQLFNSAMAKAQAEIQPVSANQINDHTKSGYANLSAIHKTCKPIWTAHGFSVSSSFYESEKEGGIGVDCEVMHSGGFVKRYKNLYPLDNAGTNGTKNKTTIQAIGSTGSYARRYVELMIFDVSVGDDDDGNGSKQVKEKDLKPAEKSLSKQQLVNLKKAMQMAGVEEKAVLEKSQIEKLEDLPQGRLAGCIRWLESSSKGESK